MSRRRKGLIVASVTGAAGLALVAAGCALSAPRWRGGVSPNFDGKRFRSSEPLHHGFFDFLRWITHHQRGHWRDFIETPPAPQPQECVGEGRLRVTFVNHSTVLIQMDGLSLLTDPVWSQRARN